MRAVVLIDGRSGSGKTTFAAELARRTNGVVVHLDDFYPGWSGLRSAREMTARTVLRSQDRGFYSWDWEKNQRGPWRDIPECEVLIVEGCGVLSGPALENARAIARNVVSAFLDGPAQWRKQRALSRDPEFVSWWDMWADQEEEHQRVRPRADFEVDMSMADLEALLKRITVKVLGS